MTKRLWALILALAVAMAAVPALAAGSVATPTDVYEREENDGHAHWAKCSAPNVCIWCGAKVSATNLTHEYENYPYSETHHQTRCAFCGEVKGLIEHTAYCDAPGKCGLCGEAGVVIKSVNHDEVMAYDADSHFWQCTRCGKATSSKQAHYAGCHEEAGKCERCGAPFNGPVQHFHGSNVARYDAVYHWFKCFWCGEDIQEKHYVQSYYWYEHEGQEPDTALCGGCGLEIRLSLPGTSNKASSNGVSQVSSPSVPLTGGEVTAATLHGNAEGLPMALVYAPRTGKATLREKASADARALRTLKDGTVVIVLEKGHRFTQVRVDGQVGYVLTAALEPIDPHQSPLGEGMLTCPTTGGRSATTVNVRIEPSASAIVAEAWPTGTMVLIWSVTENGQWYEVEYEGLRAYVHADDLTMTARYGEEAEETEEA